mmetsp:Transcript_16922/g.44486  ORF Transcript_16922/g.44486 Transcript_16922/m.44486 type:complete len:208 (-) Transcript_16922:161-784(-)
MALIALPAATGDLESAPTPRLPSLSCLFSRRSDSFSARICSSCFFSSATSSSCLQQGPSKGLRASSKALSSAPESMPASMRSRARFFRSSIAGSCSSSPTKRGDSCSSSPTNRGDSSSTWAPASNRSGTSSKLLPTSLSPCGSSGGDSDTSAAPALLAAPPSSLFAPSLLKAPPSSFFAPSLLSLPPGTRPAAAGPATAGCLRGAGD